MRLVTTFHLPLAMTGRGKLSQTMKNNVEVRLKFEDLFVIAHTCTGLVLSSDVQEANKDPPLFQLFIK